MDSVWLNSHGYHHEIEVMFAAVQMAAQLGQRIIKSSEKGVVSKEDLSPVTVADFAIQALLGATVKSAFPQDTIVGEENASKLRADLLLLEHVYEQLRWVAGDENYAKANDVAAIPPNDESDSSRPLPTVPDSREKVCNIIDECGMSMPTATGRTWVFDPIDGTKTYVRGELYAINVALLVDGQEVLGIVGCPNLDMNASGDLKNSDIHEPGCIALAVRGHGAFVCPILGKLRTDVPSKPLTGPQFGAELKDVRFVTATSIVDSALEGVHEAVAQRIGVKYPGCDILPWVLRWVLMAMDLGNTTVWVYNKKKRWGKIWDHAGAMLIYKEAGGIITDIHGKPIDLVAGRKMTGNRGFVAAPKGLHSKVLSAVHAVLQEHGYSDYLKA